MVQRLVPQVQMWKVQIWSAAQVQMQMQMQMTMQMLMLKPKEMLELVQGSIPTPV